MIAEVQTSFHRAYGSRYVGLLHKNALLKQNHILEVWESINENSWTFLCFNWDGTKAIQRQTKDWQNENVITVWEIDGSSDLTVFRINNLEWLQKGMKLSKFRFRIENKTWGWNYRSKCPLKVIPKIVVF